MTDSSVPSAPGVAPPARQAAWARHWGSGALQSCGHGPSAALGAGFERFSRPHVQALAPHARVLELGSGNGALPKAALQWRRPFDLDYDAVDLAPLQLRWWSELPPDVQSRIRFHPGVEMESLPFAGAQFDFVVSQYALEYSELERSVASLRRVARPDAALGLVCHHVDSLPVRLAATELGHLEALLAPQDGLLDCAARLLPWFAQAQSAAGRQSLRTNAQANEDRQRFNRAQELLTTARADSACPDVVDDGRAAIDRCLQLSASGALDAAQAELGDLAESLAAARLRLRELRAAALDAAAARALLALLALDETQGWELLNDRGELMGWSLFGRWRR